MEKLLMGSFGFEVGKKFTVYRISSFMATTTKAEILITEADEDGNPVFSLRGKRKKFIMELWKRAYQSAPLKPFEGAVFEGWDQPIKADSEGRCFSGNACYNFVGLVEEVKAWIESGQLNPYFERDKVLAVAPGKTMYEEGAETVVYPELYKGGHAVIDRILDKQEEVKA